MDSQDKPTLDQMTENAFFSFVSPNTHTTHNKEEVRRCVHFLSQATMGTSVE
jgi:hypothetical protein